MRKQTRDVFMALVAIIFLTGGIPLRADSLSVASFQDEIKVVFTAPSPVVSSVATAPVQSIHYRFGESFVQGELLVELDDRFYQANVEAAEATVTAATVRLDALASLYVDGNATLVDREEAAGGVKVALRNLVDAKDKLRGCNICAPFNGRVAEVLVDEHELVKNGEPLIRLVNDSVLLARFLLAEEMFASVKPGIPVKILVSSSGEVVVGTIKYIAAEVDPASRTFEVRAEVENGEGRLRTGMNACLDREALEPYLD